MPNHWRIPLVYAFAIPLALVLGYLVSSPDPVTFAILAIILIFLGLPLILKWHHMMMITVWNTVFGAFFLPGQPTLWLVFATLSFGISFVNHIIFQKKFLQVPELTRPLFFLAVVVIATACYHGGIGLRALGGAAYGGRYYIYILGAILGYFALTAYQIPISKSGKVAGIFFLSGTTNILSNLAYALGPAFYFVYYFVPTSYTGGQIASEYGLTNIDRLTGMAPAGGALFCFLLAHYGIRGIFDWTKPWRLVFLCVAVGACVLGGFRSAFMLLILIFGFQFYFEGLFRTHFLPVIIGLAVCGFIPLFLFADRMPPVVQRAVSFLPVNVDSDVREDAKGSSEWRFQMWSVVWKDVPKYLLIGKGYGIDPTDMYLTTEGIRMGLLSSYEEALLAGDYHSGPLSVIVPFGLLGAVGFLWVLFAGGWVLHSNRRYGDPRLRQINCILYAYYLSYCISFFFLFGSFHSQLYIFLGAAGLSVSLNGGVKRPVVPRIKPAIMPRILEMEPG